MRVLLVSTYELGHQPLNLASPAAALIEAGHEVRTLDTSVEPWDPGLVDWAEGVAFSVPMHTATRLAIEGARAVKGRDQGKQVCFFGLYATHRPPEVDHLIAGEYENGLLTWANGLTGGQLVDLARGRARLPVRSTLPALDRYAHLVVDGLERVAGYVEASHGCAHRCRHCPVPVVYDGRTRRVSAEVVLADIEQQVAAGAEHITFGDPDFLNRWAHSMGVVHELHDRFPDVTYDVTAKVEHLLKHADLVADLAATGCVFVVSAFESVNDAVLRYLEKGHTAVQAAESTRLLRSHGIEVRPSWLPFTPWTTVEDVAALLDFVIDNHLVGNVDPVQYTIRLLIPRGSLMLEVPEIGPYLGDFDDETLSYRWRAADERTVSLQRDVADLVERRQAEDASIADIFADVAMAVASAAGRAAPDRAAILGATRSAVPRLTEAWFCCAEPTKAQRLEEVAT